MEARSGRLLRLVALVQGLFYVATGLWSLVSIETFEMVTGPKIDDWLVKTVGVLVIVIGAVLIVAARRRQITLEILLLAVGSALGLTAIEVVYVSRGRISPIYLLDAAAELILAAIWFVAWWRERRQLQVDAPVTSR